MRGLPTGGGSRSGRQEGHKTKAESTSGRAWGEMQPTKKVRLLARPRKRGEV